MKYIKTSILLFIITLLFIFGAPQINALTYDMGYINSTIGVKIRSGPGNYPKIESGPYNAIVKINSKVETNDGSTICSEGWWSNIEYGDINGYICSQFITVTETITVPVDPVEPEDPEAPNEEEPPVENTMSKMTEEEFDAYLTAQGFPESYKVKLKALHATHPSWVFVGVPAKYTWASALSIENVSGRSLMNVGSSRKALGYEGYLSTNPGDYNYATDKFTAYDGLYWNQVNEQTLAYYLDPRTYLNETYIFIFEDLLYNESTSTLNAINSVFTTKFMRQFSNDFLTVSSDKKISAVYLAALSRQEVGQENTNIVINGKAGVLSDGVDYTGYYNFFNVGASSSGDPKLKSLQSAKAYGWDTPLKSIAGGAQTISVNYINCGQYTRYFQKWNTAPTATKGIWHQYATDILWPVGPSSTTRSSYSDMGILNADFSFSIPIYEGIESVTTSLPNLGNPNNWLSDLKVNGITVTNFSGDTTEYHVTIPYAEEVVIGTTSVSSVATINNPGTFQFEEDTLIAEIVVTAQNKATKTYTITIERLPADIPIEEEIITIEELLVSTPYKHDDKNLWNISLGTSVNNIIKDISDTNSLVSVNVKDSEGTSKIEGTIGTGDKIIISTGNENIAFDVVIYGDSNGDGEINVKDLLKIQKNILKAETLSGALLTAADINGDGEITVKDLLAIQKHILKVENISQS